MPLLPAGRCCAVDDTAVVIVVVVFVAAVVSYADYLHPNVEGDYVVLYFAG